MLAQSYDNRKKTRMEKLNLSTDCPVSPAGGCPVCNVQKIVYNTDKIQRRSSQWEQKKQEKVGEKSDEKRDECAPKSDTERTNGYLSVILTLWLHTEARRDLFYSFCDSVALCEKNFHKVRGSAVI